MRALFTFGGLLVVLAVIALLARHQLDAQRRLLPAATASAPAFAVGGASVAAGDVPQVTTDQYKRELDKVLREGAQRSADRAASAGDDTK